MENKVAERRKKMGMTQDELARVANVGQATISEIEVGKHIPQLDTAMLICEALDSKVEELFFL